jgi:NAD-dependent deacetylase
MFAEASRVVPFTGAGMSTECGIPDYRSDGGLWTKFRPIPYGEFMASAEARDEDWRRRFAMEAVFRDARPGKGHLALVALHRAGKIPGVVTQNIDGMHQAAGFPAEAVIELHGNTTYARCVECTATYPLEWVKQRFDRTGTTPECADCSHPVKAATVSFGERMPEAAMGRADALVGVCDLLVAIGSSLVVRPASSYVRMAKNCGAKVVIVNNQPTDKDWLADLVVRHDIGTVLDGAVARLAKDSR